MGENERVHSDKKEDTNQKQRTRQQDSKPLLEQYHGWDQGPFSLTETPFSPRMDEHAAILSKIPFAEQRHQFAVQLQKIYGNQYVHRLVESIRAQAKLTVSDPSDIYEQEADRVAEVVTGAVQAPVSRQEEEIQMKHVLQPQEDEVEVQMQAEEEEEIQAKPDVQCQHAPEPPEPLFVDVLRGAGVDEENIWALWDWTYMGINFEIDNPGARNPYYENIAMYAAELLELGAGATMALWSGGIDLTGYAERKHYSPLESTPLAMAYTAINQYASWELLRPLWAQLSRQFVMLARMRPVHIFVRTFDPYGGILFTEEIFALRERAQELGLQDFPQRWHMLYTGPLNNNSIDEINNEGNLVEEYYFDNPDAAIDTLIRFREQLLLPPTGR